MITIDTWVVVETAGDTVTVECPFPLENGNMYKMIISVEDIGICNIGDVLSTETGGWDYLKYNELNDLNDEGRQIFYNYINKKGFHYSFLEKYGFIADN